MALTTMCGVAEAAPTRVRPPAPAKHSTDLASLLELRDDYSKSATSITNAFVLRGDFAPAPWIGVRMELPFVYADRAKMRAAVGVGDVYARATLRLFASEISLLTGADFFLDTAATKVLGGGRNVFAPFATVAWDLGPGVWVRLQLQHLASIGGDPARGAVSAESVRPYALVSLPDGYWMVLDQTFRLDHRGPRNFGYTGVVEGGKELTREVSVFVDPGIQLDSPFALGWLMSAGVRWTMP
jgi:hypothetical protein